MLTLPVTSLTRHDPHVPERQALSMKTPASSAASRIVAPTGTGARGIAFDGADRLHLDLCVGHAKLNEGRLDGIHHGWRPAKMCPARRNLRNHRSEQRRIDAADAAGPRLIARPAHGDRDAGIGVAGL